MQQGMLFHSLYAGPWHGHKSGVYVEHTDLHLAGCAGCAGLPARLDPRRRNAMISCARPLCGRMWKNPCRSSSATWMCPFNWTIGATWGPRSSVHACRRCSRGLGSRSGARHAPGLVPHRCPPVLWPTQPGHRVLHLCVDPSPRVARWVVCASAIQGGLGVLRGVPPGTRLYLPPPRPYREYIAWISRTRSSPKRRTFGGTICWFPSSHALRWSITWRPPQSKRAMRILLAIELSPETTARLQGLARQRELTMNTLVQGAWALLLHRYSSRATTPDRRCRFWCNRPGRPVDLSGAETMVGLFINTLPMRVRVEPEAPAALAELYTRPAGGSAAVRTQRTDGNPWLERSSASQPLLREYSRL